MWSMKGSVSTPSSVTMNGTRCFMSPLMKCTSRLSRSSLATMIGAVLAALHLDEGLGEGEAFGLGKPLQGLLLGLKAETRPALLAGGHSDVTDRLPHWPLPKRADDVGMLQQLTHHVNRGMFPASDSKGGYMLCSVKGQFDQVPQPARSPGK